MAACRMKATFQHHIPVLLHEAVSSLLTTADGIYIDATFGRGSHSKAILEKLSPTGKLFAFDKDPEAVSFAQQQFAYDPRFQIFHASFAEMEKILSPLNLLGKISGILFDLGVSSPQLDNPARGFSFMKSGPLDMRMNTDQGMDAAAWLASVSEETLANVLWQYGEEKFSRRIARAIIQQREIKPIKTTDQLAALVSSCVPRTKKEDKHPATRTFQAIRIAINQELTDLSLALQQTLPVLAPGGRLAVISFHSLEDRIVKQFIRQMEKGPELPRGLPIKHHGYVSQLKSLGKPIKPELTEMNINPRARSAILRIAEKPL